jgi:hypothetical protein
MSQSTIIILSKQPTSPQSTPTHTISLPDYLRLLGRLKLIEMV